MRSEVSSTTPDWSREALRPGEWNPGKSLLKSIREYQRYRESRTLFAVVLRRSAVLRHRFWSAVSGADIPLNCQIDGGLLLPHPNGIVVHPSAKIGPNCLLFQQVTWAPEAATVPQCCKVMWMWVPVQSSWALLKSGSIRKLAQMPWSPQTFHPTLWPWEFRP